MSLTLMILVATVAATLTLSFLCSVLEATLLSSRLPELEHRRGKGDRGAALLFELKQDRLDDAISAILTLNTVSHTSGAALAGAQVAAIYGDAWVGLFGGLLTLLMLVVTEIIPKTLGTVYASQLVGFVARVTHWLTILLKPALWVLRFITRSLARKEESSSISRAELAAMVNLAAREGSLPAADSKLMSNVLRLGEIKVEDIMTPRTVIGMLPAEATIADFLAAEDTLVFSRIPLYKDNHDNVTGFVLQRDVLLAAANDQDPQTPITKFLRKALFIQEGQVIGRVMRRLIETREHLALITDEYGGISGLVTLEDLVETTLGVEILDESDRVIDLRAEAIKLRERRLESMRRWRHDVEKRDTPPDPERS